MNLKNFTLKNFTELDNTEKSIVLSWRNDKNVRKWMYNSEIISIKNHMKFITGLINDVQNQYFLIKDGSESIGVIYFNKIDKENNSCYFGLYGASNSNVRGLGRILEEISINYTFNVLKVNKLKLEVFEDNIQVINLHKKYKFIINDEKVINNKKVICMELKNENR
ncbi:MAG: UDP-4-amino-4,6-dideoxy-N-acetyl-beta-L-altrosamine N-acetyltransferase [Arcobacter sp.]|nr:UDP-4-amino-4,6-dideoxy-N-acetyl-beta-L-altrosamine N-acetyltransferase [Arcobacter sp.]|tara:strand:+ start:5833 stop:6330 length:498 start_codon:yes stop_codon:yes gene_type:complete